MSDDMKRRDFAMLARKGLNVERRLPPQLESLGRQDRAVRSIPPGGPLPKRYNRNVIGELLSERYGESHPQDAADDAPEVPEAKRVVVARKAGTDRDDGKGGGPSAVPLTDESPRKKKRGFLGFGRR